MFNIAVMDSLIAEKSIKQTEQDIQIAENAVQKVQMLSLIAQREIQLLENGGTEKLDGFMMNFHHTYKF